MNGVVNESMGIVVLAVLGAWVNFVVAWWERKKMAGALSAIDFYCSHKGIMLWRDK